MAPEKKIDRAMWWLHAKGIRPNHLTYAQTPFYVGLVLAGLSDDVWAFFWLTVLAVIFDGFDGTMARRTNTVSRRGHMLDSAFDILGIGITIWAANEIFPGTNSIPLLPFDQLLVTLLVINFLVYLQNEMQGTKAITYTRGPLIGGMVMEQYWPGLLLVGVLLPMLIGLALLFTRVAWRRRIWNWYSFVTAGLRVVYKAVPKRERSAMVRHPTDFPTRGRDETAEAADDGSPTAKP